MRKSVVVAFLTALMVCGFALACTTHFCTVQAATDVSGIPKPSVPEFTVELVDSSYDVPTTYSTDPYTGKTITHEGYHVERRTIEVRIKNQPFTPYTDSDGRNIKFYYNVRTKGHFTEEWVDVYNAGEMPTQSNSEYTVISYNSDGGLRFYLGTTSRMLEVSPGGQVDFQVQALVGYTQDTVTLPGFHGWVFTGETSGWSNTQTLTIGESQTPMPSPAITPTPTPYQEPRQNEQTEAIIGVVIVAVVLGAALGLLIYLIKRK